MRRKAGKILLLVIVAAMLLATAFYMLNKFVENPFVNKNVLDRETENSASSRNKTEETKVPYPVSKRGYGILPYEGNIEKIGEGFIIEDELQNIYSEFCVNKVQFTKERVDTDAIYRVQADTDSPVQFDEEYNILNDFNYVVVNMTIRNLAEEEMEIYMTSFRYFSYDILTEDAADVYYAGKVRGYKTLETSYSYDKSYARVIIQGGKEFTCNLVYLQRDEDIGGKIPYLHYSHTGISIPYDEEGRFVRLDQ